MNHHAIAQAYTDVRTIAHNRLDHTKSMEGQRECPGCGKVLRYRITRAGLTSARCETSGCVAWDELGGPG